MRKKTIILLIASILLATFTLTGCINIPKRVRVPDVIGLDADDAHQAMLDVQLVPYLIEGSEAPEIKLEWTVYLQDPAASTRVPKNSGVELTYYTTIPPPPVEAREIIGLGTCLPGSEHMMKDLGLKDAYGNAFDWPDYSTLRELGLKAFICISASGPEDEAYVRMIVEQYKDDPVTGGYWNESMGHEPDIVGVSIELRAWFYDLVRSIDPDVFGHPVMEMFNLTSKYDFPDAVKDKKILDWQEKYPVLAASRITPVGYQYPGWEDSYSENPKTADVTFIDCYSFQATDEEMREEITRFFRKFVKVYVHKNQLVPQMDAFRYRPGSIWAAYNIWNDLLASEEFDNPYRGKKMGVYWYKDETVRQNAEIQREIKEITEAMRRKE